MTTISEYLETILIVFNETFINFRNLRYSIQLALLRTNLPSNHNTIQNIHKEVLNSALFESFLESAPQLVLQCTILIKTGRTSKIFEIHMTFHSNVCYAFIPESRGFESRGDQSYKVRRQVLPILSPIRLRA